MSENLKNIDQMLEAQSQRAVAHLVSSLPDEMPSMVWRSGLNEALQAHASKHRRRHRFFLIARPALGLVAACALAVIVLIRPSTIAPMPATAPSVATAPLEASLVTLHQDDVRTMDVAGVGLDPNEPALETTSSTTTSGADDSEADLEL